MATWYKVKWIDPLFAAFNALAPGRPKGSDGTIGDTAHQSGASGHNPDDTAGSKAERTDADSRPEVRAADVTTISQMQAAIDAVLRTPADRDRFIYIIFNRRIWEARNGWKPRAYTGSDPHTGHAHFSGDPARDENGAPFTSILSLTGGGTMASPWDEPIGGLADGATRPARQVLADVWNGEYHSGGEATNNPAMGGYAERHDRSMSAQIREVLTAVQALAGGIGGGVTHADLVAALKEALQDPAVAAVLAEAAFDGAQRAEQQ